MTSGYNIMVAEAVKWQDRALAAEAREREYAEAMQHANDVLKRQHAEIEKMRADLRRVEAIAGNERADYHSIGFAIVSLVDGWARRPTAGSATPTKCICPRFKDTGGVRIADLTCPIHGVGGTDPGDGYWDDEAQAGSATPDEEYGPKVLAKAVLNDRASRRLTQEDVVARARQNGKTISLNTLRNVENARMQSELRSGSIQGLAAGLDWTVGRVVELLYGTTR